MTITIQDVTPADKTAWEGLWDQYLAFYETERGQDIKDETWRRILDPEVPMFCYLAVNSEGMPVGLTNFLFHLSFWEKEEVCYLNDLFVLPQTRGQGAAAQLIAAVHTAAQARSTAKVYWLTAENNYAARTLYDKVARKTPFVHYMM